jgi:DNA-binding IclR family transcriptional regulator
MNPYGAADRVPKTPSSRRGSRLAPKQTFQDQTEAGGVAAVERALTVLEALLEAGKEITLAELAARTGFYKSTILRLIVSLEAFGYVRKLDSGEYHLGAKVFELGGAYQKSFRLEKHVLPILREMVTETTESAAFYIRNRNQRIVLFRIDSDHHGVLDNVRPGDRLPLDRGAAGRILLNFAEGYRTAPPSEFVAATFGERQPDTAAVAAPVFGAGGKTLGAIGVSGPRSRFTTAAVKRFERVVLEKATALTTRLGGPANAYPRPNALLAS